MPHLPSSTTGNGRSWVSLGVAWDRLVSHQPFLLVMFAGLAEDDMIMVLDRFISVQRSLLVRWLWGKGDCGLRQVAMPPSTTRSGDGGPEATAWLLTWSFCTLV